MVFYFRGAQSCVPGHLDDWILDSDTLHLWVHSVEFVSCPAYGAVNFEVAASCLLVFTAFILTLASSWKDTALGKEILLLQSVGEWKRVRAVYR
jgi:hypothetical protein